MSSHYLLEQHQVLWKILYLVALITYHMFIFFLMDTFKFIHVFPGLKHPQSVGTQIGPLYCYPTTTGNRRARGKGRMQNAPFSANENKIKFLFVP